MPRIPFNAAEKDTMRKAAQSVWNEIAYDTFVTVYQEGRDTLTRDEVVELVLDCDRVLRAVERIDQGLSTRMRRADARQIELIVRDAFPDREYA